MHGRYLSFLLKLRSRRPRSLCSHPFTLEWRGSRFWGMTSSAGGVTPCGPILAQQLYFGVLGEVACFTFLSTAYSLARPEIYPVLLSLVSHLRGFCIGFYEATSLQMLSTSTGNMVLPRNSMQVLT